MINLVYALPMLLAKLNALKNYVNPKRLIQILNRLAFVPVGLFSFNAFAEEPQSANTFGPQGSELLALILALFFVVALIIALSWVVKRFNLVPGTGQSVKVVASTSLGGRERVVIIDVQGAQHAIGVSSQQVNYLFALDQPISKPAEPLRNHSLAERILSKVVTPPTTSQAEDTRRD